MAYKLMRYKSFLNEDLSYVDFNTDPKLYDDVIEEFGISKNDINIFIEDGKYIVEFNGNDIDSFEEEYGEYILADVIDFLNSEGDYEGGIEVKKERVKNFNIKLKQELLEYNFHELDECLLKFEDYKISHDQILVIAIDSNDQTVDISHMGGFNIKISDNILEDIEKNHNFKLDGWLENYDLFMSITIESKKDDLKNIIRLISICNQSCDDIYLNLEKSRKSNDDIFVDITINKY